MKKTKIKINEITIEIDGNKIKLPIEAAKELRDMLNETFPKKTEEKHIHHHDHWRWWNTNPVWYSDPTPSITFTNDDGSTTSDYIFQCDGNSAEVGSYSTTSGNSSLTDNTNISYTV